MLYSVCYVLIDIKGMFHMTRNICNKVFLATHVKFSFMQNKSWLTVYIIYLNVLSVGFKLNILWLNIYTLKANFWFQMLGNL